MADRWCNDDNSADDRANITTLEWLTNAIRIYDMMPNRAVTCLLNLLEVCDS